WQDAVTAYQQALRLIPDYAGALYNLGIAYLRLGQRSASEEVAAKVKPLDFDLQARLWQEILAAERPANVAAIPAPTPVTPPPSQTSSAETSPGDSDDRAEKGSTSNSAADEECPSPI